MENKISEEDLLKRGLTKHYSDRIDGFYLLQNVDDKFYFTVDFKTMTVSIQLNGYGHIKKLKNIETITDFDNLVFAVTGTKLEVKKIVSETKPEKVCPHCGKCYMNHDTDGSYLNWECKTFP